MCEVRRRKFEKSNKTWGVRGLFPNLFALISMGVVNAAVVPSWRRLLMVMGGNILFGLGVDWQFSTTQSSDSRWDENFE